MKWVISLRWIDHDGRCGHGYWSPRLGCAVPWGPEAARGERSTAEAAAVEDLAATAMRWTVIPEAEAV